MYSSLQVAELNCFMDENHFRRNLGVSWAEIDGKRVEYVTGDQKAGWKHLQKIEEAYSQICKTDHTHTSGPHDSEDCHSEKLLLAEFLWDANINAIIKMYKNSGKCKRNWMEFSLPQTCVMIATLFLKEFPTAMSALFHFG